MIIRKSSAYTLDSLHDPVTLREKGTLNYPSRILQYNVSLLHLAKYS